MPLRKFSLKPRLRRKAQGGAPGGGYSSVEPEERAAPPAKKDDPPTAAEEDVEDIGDVPRTVSARIGSDEPPPPETPGRDREDGYEGREEDDSLGSPTEGFRKEASPARGAAVGSPDQAERHSMLQGVVAEEASMDNMRTYIDSLGGDISPNTGSDLPSRALRCLFALSESSGSRAERLAMVGGAFGPISKEDGAADEDRSDGGKGGGSKEENDEARALIPALLAFLGRCPRDSSEQYLTLLVLNNLSIPTANKRTIAVTHGGAAVLGRLLCEDPGCHLLVIILVNLTFGDGSLNLDLVRRRDDGKAGGKRRKKEGPLEFLMRSPSDREREAAGEEDGGAEGEDPQLVECICYALLLSSLTANQLERLGPIPMTDEDGAARRPAELFATLTSMLSDEASVDLLGPLDVASPDRPFPETARWCMSALKNLTRPGRLAPSRLTGGEGQSEEDEAAAIASRAIIGAGMLPLLVGILRADEGPEGKEEDDAKKEEAPYNWQSNTLQDSALYTLLHMSAVPGVRGELMTEQMNCAEVLSRICEACGRREARKDLGDLGQMRLQQLKARMALSYLLDSLDTDDRHSSNLISDREAGTLVALLSDTLAGRARDGPGGYSAATFGAKGVLYAVRCLLTEPRNRALFASSAHGMKLNALLVRTASRFAAAEGGGVCAGGIVDAEAAEHAAVSLYWTTMYSLDEAAVGFDTATYAGPFLPVTSVTGGSKADAVSAVAGTLSSLAAANGVTAMTGQAAHQIMLRLDYLKYEEEPVDFFVSVPGDLNLDRVEGGLDGETAGPPKKGAKPTFHIFDRDVTRSIQGSIMPNKAYSSAYAAAEESMWSQTGLFDVFDMANNIAYYAEGSDVYASYIWKWADGNGDTIDRAYSREESDDLKEVKRLASSSAVPSRIQAMLDKVKEMSALRVKEKDGGEDEPTSIFGFVCGANMCGQVL